jgi:hypothetical protein
MAISLKNLPDKKDSEIKKKHSEKKVEEEKASKVDKTLRPWENFERPKDLLEQIIDKIDQKYKF